MSDSSIVSDDAAGVQLIQEEGPLAAFLGDTVNEGRTVHTRLRASGRVIARVTDGIYRRPASALRELISNAWDADAQNVTILTDAPRFSCIYVRDDGMGMSYDALSRLLHHIGGSAKRRQDGQDLGITSPDDIDQTPGGRPLIGKIGIGLFSVSQLARSFRIITKVAGQPYRLTAEVRLRAYTEDGSDDVERENDDAYVSGDVYITREHAEDVAAHGTDIVIDDVKPRVRDLLRSAERWRELERKKQAELDLDFETLATLRVEKPVFHTGWISNLADVAEGPVRLTEPARFPWKSDTASSARMSSLMDGVEAQFAQTARPELTTTLDAYLEMLWELSVSIPVQYVEKHPFDLKGGSGLRLYWLSNESRGQATEVPLLPEQTVREAVQEHVDKHPVLKDGLPEENNSFRVEIDGFELKRPVRFRFYSTSSKGLEHAMLFVGRYSPRLTSVDPDQRGGGLSFEGYLFWTGRVVPKENNGVLIRIRGASGALFDQTFLGYQISEQTRLRQISSELFVKRGVDAALNIDRESFNFSHPHVVLLSAWLHRAIRQLTNRHKEVSQRLLEARKEAAASERQDHLASFSARVWSSRQGSEPLPDVAIADNEHAVQSARNRGAIAILRSELPSLSANSPRSNRADRDTKARALVRILAAYGVLNDRTYTEQQELIEAVMRVFFSDAEER